MMQHEKETICRALGISQNQFVEYPSSFTEIDGDQFQLCKIEESKNIIAWGKGAMFQDLKGIYITETIKLCPLTHENRLVLNRHLPYTLPTSFGKQVATFGVGDRLGLATPGHIHCLKNSIAKPIFAQQSKRELDLTGRNYNQVLDDVCFAVFQEGYEDGFGADGDHLKKVEDIKDALDCGYTMITLDCSEKIGRGIEELTNAQAKLNYESLPLEYRQRIENTYLDQIFLIGIENYAFTKAELIQCALIYGEAIGFVNDVYHNYLIQAKQSVDFELSIDETESITTGLAHLFVALELIHLRVDITSLAPRFVGEFQKGIDYIGNGKELEIQLEQHCAIADHFGYKLSIHSGSDKFSVFPMIGKYTRKRLHIKTSGTNWLEAIGTIAECNPPLYRRIHKKALEHFQEAKVFYHVSADLDMVPDLDNTEDCHLIQYLDNNHSRQLLHITYGFILQEDTLKSEIYSTLKENEVHYQQRLVSHIGRHLTEIGLS